METEEFNYLISLGMNNAVAVFAVELSKTFNYPLVAFVDERNAIRHFCCEVGNKFIDATGYCTLEQHQRYYQASYQGNKLRSMIVEVDTVEQLIRSNQRKGKAKGCSEPTGYHYELQRLFKSQRWTDWVEQETFIKLLAKQKARAN